MFSFRSFALVLAVTAGAAFSAPAQQAPAAQESSSASQQPAQQPNAQQQPATPNQGSMSVQQRIRERRARRRAQAIRDVYSHPWEAYLGMGYMRFVPGPNLQRTTMYSWNAEYTRYYTQRLGVTADARGNYGTTYVGVQSGTNITKPSVATYSGLLGPTYRFLIEPKYSISGRAMGGYIHGDFSGDTNGVGTKLLGLYPDSGTFAANVSVVGEYNLSNSLGFRLAPEYDFSGFGSSLQASRGFTLGFVFRFGKQ